jgi:hypothetical protein
VEGVVVEEGLDFTFLAQEATDYTKYIPTGSCSAMAERCLLAVLSSKYKYVYKYFSIPTGITLPLSALDFRYVVLIVIG